MAQDIDRSKILDLLAELSRDFVNDAYVRGPGQPDRISRKGNRFSLISAEGTVDPPNPHALDFVVVRLKRPSARYYYDGVFNADNPTPPTCKSVDSITPDVDSPQAETCGVCPKSTWGSSTSPITGRGVPACKSHKEMVIKVLGVRGIWLLDIPPDSIKPWEKMVTAYDNAAADAARDKGKSVPTMLNYSIRAEFEPDRMGTLKFRPMGYLTAAEGLELAEILKKESAIDRMLWGSPERRAQYEEAIAPKPLRGPSEPDRPPPPPPLPEPPKKPLTGSGTVPNGPQRSRRAPYSRPDTVDTDAALDEIFKGLGDE